MTHETRIQRGDPADFSQATLERGHEASDAPPGKVLLAVAAFLSVVGFALGAAALVAGYWDGTHPRIAQRAQQPPRPRLLAYPEQERIELESAARRRLDDGPVPIERAMAETVRQGWGEAAPAPPTRDVARQHVEAIR